MIQLRYFIAFFSIVLFACNESDPDPISNLEMIAGADEFGKTWKISKVRLNLADLSGEFEPDPCIKDNFIRYYPNGLYELSESLLKCDASDPASYTGNWSLSSSGDELTIVLPDSIRTWEVEVLTSRTHEISSEFVDGERTYILVSQN